MDSGFHVVYDFQMCNTCYHMILMEVIQPDKIAEQSEERDNVY